MEQWESNRRVQTIAKAVLDRLGLSITESDSEASIAERAACLLAEKGVEETWYHDCLAFVLLGSRSCDSISGRQYKPSSEPVGQFNLVTVDLSPCLNGAWGDCARSFVIESGQCVLDPKNREFRRGLEFELRLHASMQEFVSIETTFENSQIIKSSLVALRIWIS